MRSSNLAFTRCLGALEETVEEFCRSEFGRHLINSHKELLLALRSAIDKKVEKLDRLTQRGELKEVEVE